MSVTSGAFWASLGSIIITNLVLSGDNAVVIALAARSLPPNQRMKAILFGSAAAIALRVALTLVALQLLQLPFLKLSGAALLLYVGVQLLIEEKADVEGEHDVQPLGLGSAVRTILVADLVMSLDNVLAVAAAARGNVLLLAIGLALSVPLIVFGSALLMGMMRRWPVIITVGGALLGYLAGEMSVADPALTQFAGPLTEPAGHVAGLVGAVLVLCGAALVRQAHSRRRPTTGT